MAYHCAFRPMVCLERTRTKTERFNRVILKLKEQLAGWPMGFVGPATGQSRVRSTSGLSRRSRSTAVVAASIGRPGDAFHCSATTRTCPRQRRVRLHPLRVPGSLQSVPGSVVISYYFAPLPVRLEFRCFPVFVVVFSLQ